MPVTYEAVTTVGEIALASGQIIVGNSTGKAQARTMSGGATMSNTGVITITSASGTFSVAGAATFNGTSTFNANVLIHGSNLIADQSYVKANGICSTIYQGGGFSTPPTEAEIESVFGAPDLYPAGTHFWVQDIEDPSVADIYMIMTTGAANWRISPIFVPA